MSSDTFPTLNDSLLAAPSTATTSSSSSTDSNPLAMLARAVDTWPARALSTEERMQALGLLMRLLCKLDCPASKLLEYAALEVGPLRLTVLETTNGPDAIDQHNHYWELKTSVVKVKKGLKTNWNWDLDKADWQANLEAKMSAGGGAILRALNSEGELLRQYVLSQRFVVEYFRNLRDAKGNRPKAHNMGCQRCRSCHHWHRALRLERAAGWFDLGHTVDFAKLQSTNVETHRCSTASTSGLVTVVTGL